jgi:hypothetical protein
MTSVVSFGTTERNYCANVLQRAARRFWQGRQIFVYGFRGNLASHNLKRFVITLSSCL